MMESLRLEAENLTLDGGYTVESGDFASGSALIRLLSDSGVATAVLAGLQAGTYDLVVAYYDESDGQSPLTVQLDGVTVDSWTFDQNLGDTRASASNLVKRTISGLTLDSASTIQLLGGQKEGENARIDYIELIPVEPVTTTDPSTTPEPDTSLTSEPDTSEPNTSEPNTSEPNTSEPVTSEPTPTTTTTTPLKIEAETMTLGGAYSIENGDFASGGKLIRVTDLSSSGTATTTFSGSSGTYDLVVAYYDENDGKSPFSLKVNGTTVGTWVADQSLGNTRASASNLVKHTISGVSLSAGATIQLVGTQHEGENARVDYLELIPTGATTPPPNTAPVAQGDSYSTTQNKALTIDAVSGVLKNDTDADGDSLTVTGYNTTTAQGGTISMTGSGAFTYNPASGFSGNDSFSYTINDGKGGSSSATVAIAVNPATNSPSPTPLKIEAETMTLGGAYSIENGDFASGGKLIRVTDLSSSGTATTTFNGSSGTYDLVVAYYDENDGKSPFSLKVNGTTVGTWVADQSLGNTRASASNLVKHTISGVSLSAGATIQLVGTQHEGENARVDYLELIPTASTGGGSSSGGDTSGSGGAGDYSSAANGIIADLSKGTVFKPLYGNLAKPKIMPLGDSITAGQHSVDPVPGAYRIQMWNRFSTDGLSVDFVGSQSNGPTSLGDKDHEGRPGWWIDQITGLVDGGLLGTYKPDVITLMIGSNDVNNLSALTEIESDLSRLIDRIAQASPSTYLAVSSISPINPDSSTKHGSPQKAKLAADYNAKISSLVSQKASQGKNVTYLNAGGSLTLSDLNSDGLHPTAAGYNKLGNAWYDGLIKKDTLAAGTDSITGSAFSDTVVGNSTANIIRGNLGADMLTGGGGVDTFVYKTATEGGDRITDFGLDDIFSISAAGFGGGLKAGVALSTSAASTGVFVSGSNPNALGTSANFLFNTVSKLLSFDIDGTGSATAIAIATLDNVNNLSASQFSIVA